MAVWVGLAAFAGSWCGTTVGGVLVWRYYIKPRMNRAQRAVRLASARPSPSQPTATTAGFVRHEKPVTVSTVGFGRVKKATRL
jgi:hypothetical protein